MFCSGVPNPDKPGQYYSWYEYFELRKKLNAEGLLDQNFRKMTFPDLTFEALEHKLDENYYKSQEILCQFQREKWALLREYNCGSVFVGV